MKKLGYVLIVVGFLAGAYYAVEQPEGVATGPFLVALALCASGVAIVRYLARREATSGTRVSANLEAIGSSLDSIVQRVGELAANKEAIDVYDLRHHIDRELPESLDTFVQARDSLSHRFGLQAYADVMNPFAAGERYLNRVWSTSTDGYIDEAHTYLDKALEQFRDAQQVYAKLSAG